MSKFDSSETLQKELYNSISERYATHYGDYWSQVFREKFFNRPLFEGVELKGTKVLDAMCGSGETTQFLVANGADVTGVDISDAEIENFHERFPQCEFKCASILATGLPDNAFDAVVIVGGLHHVHPNVIPVVEEVKRVLKQNGRFCFIEPHTGSFPDVVRKIWYRHDSMFADNEAAVDFEELRRVFANDFEFMKQEYKGNIGYLLVLNSMAFRIPVALKRYYSPFLIWVESIIERVQGRFFSCYVVSQWVKS